MNKEAFASHPISLPLAQKRSRTLSSTRSQAPRACILNTRKGTALGRVIPSAYELEMVNI
eukprot:2196546-Amphidinium_carterae.1